MKQGKKDALFFNKKYLANYIWGQTSLEGETISYISTETFLENINNKKRNIFHMIEDKTNFSVYSIELLTGLKNGWDEIHYFLKNDEKSKLSLNELIHLNDTLSWYEEGKQPGIRSGPVKISGCNYVPECTLIASQIEEELNDILESKESDLDKSIELFLYSCKTQIFYDGNKRTALLHSSFHLINNGIASGIFINPATVNEFKYKLLNFYEDDQTKNEIIDFLKKECIDYTNDFKLTDEYKNIFLDDIYDQKNTLKNKL